MLLKYEETNKKYALEVEHYFVTEGWKSDFCESINLDWIPNYIIVESQENIKLYKAVKVIDTYLNHFN